MKINIGLNKSDLISEGIVLPGPMENEQDEGDRISKPTGNQGSTVGEHMGVAQCRTITVYIVHDISVMNQLNGQVFRLYVF